MYKTFRMEFKLNGKIGRGIILFATCEFILGVNNNTIKITTALNQAILYQGIVVFVDYSR